MSKQTPLLNTDEGIREFRFSLPLRFFTVRSFASRFPIKRNLSPRALNRKTWKKLNGPFQSFNFFDSSAKPSALTGGEKSRKKVARAKRWKNLGEQRRWLNERRTAKRCRGRLRVGYLVMTFEAASTIWWPAWRASSRLRHGHSHEPRVSDRVWTFRKEWIG